MSQSHYITQEVWESAMDYHSYNKLIDLVVSEERTTGPKQSADLTQYTKVNRQRMRRIEKTLPLEDEVIQLLQANKQKWYWLVITEAWCGDAAQNIPVMAKMVDASPTIELKLILRDEHPTIMDNFLTNGGKSTPVLVCLRQEDLQLVGSWGPRPEPVQKIINNAKTANTPLPQMIERAQAWYASDKTRTFQQEMKDLIPKWKLKSMSLEVSN